MYIETFHLRNFRNYIDQRLIPGKGLNLLVGLNAQGKSNLLEAITLLATTRSFRNTKEHDLIRLGQERASLAASVSRLKNNDVEIEVFLSRSEKKVIRLNQVRRPRMADLLGNLNAVIFSGEDLCIVRGEPSDRRRFLNIEISQASPSYCLHLMHYKKTIDQRNKLLKEIQTHPSLAGTLQSWNMQLVEHGSRLCFKRWEYIKLIDVMAREIHKQLTDGQEELVIEYRSSIPLKNSINLESIQNSYRDALERAAANEIFRGISLIGPHRDDLIFKINGSDARVFASQGQQRTAVLSVKLAEMQLLSEVIGESPVVLLDDVMSELDDRRRAQIFQYLADDCQVFITCTNLEALSPEMAKKAEILTVQEGRIECALKKA